MLATAGVGALAVASLPAQAATESEPSESLLLGRRWVDALNRRDLAGLTAVLHDDFQYSSIARNPPELIVRWNRDKFLGITTATAGSGSGFRKPVLMKTVSEVGAGDRAVIEAEGYSELDDGYVYANVYCFNFWTKDSKIVAIHDYCCTHTAWLMGQHAREKAVKMKAAP
jgi:ketosteroid isomerase-like protein